MVQVGFEPTTYSVWRSCTTAVLLNLNGGGWENRTLINSLQSCRNPIILIPQIGLGRKNRTSISWSQTTNSTIKLHRVKCSAFPGGNYSAKRYDAIIALPCTFHPLPDRNRYRIASGLSVQRLPPVSNELTSLPVGHSSQALPWLVLAVCRRIELL